MARFLVDFPSGPLDGYREKASFDWKKLKVFLETEEILEYKHELYRELKRYPLLCSHNRKTPTLDEQRYITTKQFYELRKLESVGKDLKQNNYRKFSVFRIVLSHLNPSLFLKYSMYYSAFHRALQDMGSERHAHFVKQSLNGELIGCFCLTEIGHGSNTKKMQTTATFDRKTKEFVLHSPNFEAAKCWAGNLGQSATHAVVYAQLITPDGVNHSLHPFVVQIRDPKTLLPYPGITVGDMGEKIGLNGLDNGFIMFHHYRIPRENLLNKTGDVNEDGIYTTTFKDPSRRFGATLSVLSLSRSLVSSMSAVNAVNAITIAIRYAAVRRQFAEDKEEVPIIEYQSLQYRLFPHLATTYILKIFTTYLVNTCYEFNQNVGIKFTNKLTTLGLELHAISAAVKPLASWAARDATQECREACAAHGYLKASGIGEVRNYQDIYATVEGENNVLIQQTSNWLLKLWSLVLKNRGISFPLKSVYFINKGTSIVNNKLRVNSLEMFTTIENVLHMFQWLVCYLLKASYEKQECLIKQGLSLFWAKSESQVYFCKSLALAYIQHFIVQRTCVTISESDDPQIKNILTNLLLLFSMVSLEKHIPAFYIGGYASGPDFADWIQESILKLCRILKDDAVALVDSIAPPDFLLKSILGKSDGQVYKHLEEAIFSAPEALVQPKWWKEFLPNNHLSKL